MKPRKYPDGVMLVTDDAQITAELSRRGLLTELQHLTAIGPWCVWVVPDKGATDIFLATYVDPKDSGLVWYRFVGKEVDHPSVRRIAEHLRLMAGPFCLIRQCPFSMALSLNRHSEGGGNET